MSATKLKALSIMTLSIALGMGSISPVSAEEKLSDQEYSEFLDQAAQSMPELNEKSDQQTRSGSGMSCYVDTLAFDVFTSGYCFSAGNATTTSAVFRIDNPPSNYTILWSDSRCSSSNTLCILPIRRYQSYTISATILNNANNTFTTASATAEYEGLF